MWRIDADGDSFRVSVTDSGDGIAAEFLPHLFSRFRQADGTTTRCHGGLSLGLAIVQSLVEMHGGYVGATSPGLGKGAMFTVSLLRYVCAIDVADTVICDRRVGSAGDQGSIEVISLFWLYQDAFAKCRFQVGCSIAVQCHCVAGVSKAL